MSEHVSSKAEESLKMRRKKKKMKKKVQFKDEMKSTKAFQTQYYQLRA